MSLQVAQKAQVVKQHQRAGNDTGSPEVQIALLTERINGPLVLLDDLRLLRDLQTHALLSF